MVTIDNGSQDDVWGQATSLLGQLGSVAVFNEALKETQMTTLYNIGKISLVKQCFSLIKLKLIFCGYLFVK